MGKASLITAGAFCLLMLVSVGIADLLAALMPGGMDRDAIIAVLLCLTLVGSLIALRLGIGGASQNGRDKLPAMAGIATSAITIMGTGLLSAIVYAPH